MESWSERIVATQDLLVSAESSEDLTSAAFASCCQTSPSIIEVAPCAALMPLVVHTPFEDQSYLYTGSTTPNPKQGGSMTPPTLPKQEVKIAYFNGFSPEGNPEGAATSASADRFCDISKYALATPDTSDVTSDMTSNKPSSDLTFQEEPPATSDYVCVDKEESSGSPTNQDRQVKRRRPSQSLSIPQPIDDDPESVLVVTRGNSSIPHSPRGRMVFSTPPARNEFTGRRSRGGGEALVPSASNSSPQKCFSTMARAKEASVLSIGGFRSGDAVGSQLSRANLMGKYVKLFPAVMPPRQPNPISVAGARLRTFSGYSLLDDNRPLLTLSRAQSSQNGSAGIDAGQQGTPKRVTDRLKYKQALQNQEIYLPMDLLNYSGSDAVMQPSQNILNYVMNRRGRKVLPTRTAIS